MFNLLINIIYIFAISVAIVNSTIIFTYHELNDV